MQYSALQYLNLLSPRLFVRLWRLPIPESSPVPTDAAPLTYASISRSSLAKKMVQSLDSTFFSFRLSSFLATLDAISTILAKSLCLMTDTALLFPLAIFYSWHSMPSISPLTSPEYGPRSWPLKSLGPAPSIDHGFSEDRHRGWMDSPLNSSARFNSITSAATVCLHGSPRTSKSASSYTFGNHWARRQQYCWLSTPCTCVTNCSWKTI